MSREDERSESSVDASGEAASRGAGAPRDLLDAHPETAYFWGRVVGDGGVTEGGVTVRTSDETAAERLAAIAGADAVDRRAATRQYAHDTSITRSEERYTVQVHGSIGGRAAAAFGLPLDGGSGGYRLDALAEFDRQLLRGLLEGCGTVCFKSSSGTVGISFVHDDRKLLERIRGLLADAAVEAPVGEISETSSGGYWFGLDDAAAPTVGEWLYRGTEDRSEGGSREDRAARLRDSEKAGLFAPSRRRKLRRSIEEAEAY